ncbi:SusC/RagA family TonB-linked outer membrane protein [Chitinophaga japonensis]|uniref:Iron complex outermembrane receptor protein n=1 Tax=Chitinophaga japonensis TaxID=104662 RepID=A0A562T537_CHIJA|nr:SusC/RagA family TonB-linked outer membrane protein [Chitinophaga japonensis]TWI88388.1 iron complex outermembrane receptor protein [Chitinophaga japonensis]
MKRSLLVCAVLFLWCTNIVLAQEKKTIAGIVQDEKGNPLVGVSVQEKGTSNGTLSDQNGAFKLSADPEGTLIFTYVGYLRQEVPLNGRVSLAIRMAPDSKGLNEIVVTAMGIKKERRKLGYALATVSGDELVKAAPTNFASALYGRAAGVRIQTTPGGATSAATIQIRGINSITQDNQPLIVLDGVPIRKDIVNTGSYDSDTRLRGNSLLDINPDNIQDISILKGAAATALYGSDGANGVVVITSKAGSKKRQGIGVDFNYSYGIEQVGIVPEYQTEYGPGYDRATNIGLYGSPDGWVDMGDLNGDGRADVRPSFRAYGQFGRKFDGSDIYYWDGSTRKYVGHKDNWKDFYQNGYSSIANIALSGATDKSDYRISYVRNDYKGVQIGGKQQKNTFNLNATYKVNSRLSTDITVTYVNEKVHNRPEQIHNLTAAFNGMFSAADYMDVYFDKYKTTKDYKYVPYNQSQRDPDEALKYDIRAYNFMDFLWKQLMNSYDEYSNRVITSATLNYEIINGLRFRGRVGNDFTGYTAETKEHTEYPLSFGETGKYITDNNQYSIIYSDLLLAYTKKFSPRFTLNASVGYQARRHENRYSHVSTEGGLTQENWFSTNASKNALSARSPRSYYLQDGLFGILGLEYRNMLFLEGTIRRERVSTLFPENNIYYYPSVSASFELSRAMELPRAFDYVKLRAGYGGVASPAEAYTANVVYTGATVNSVPYLYPSSSYGNNALDPQLKYETEAGLEVKMLEGRFGLDVSYYTNITKGQILPLTLSPSTGANSIWTNVGDMQNYGVEVALNGVPYTSRNFEWNVRGTLGYNRNKVKSLMDGLEELQLTDVDNGALRIVAKPGSNAGDIMVYRRKTNEEGKYIVNSSGYYDIDVTKQEKVGNIQPDLVGGIGNTLRYKNWSLDFLVDFRWGGQMVSATNYLARGAGLLTNSLQGRDQAHGGITYYEDGTGAKIPLAPGASAPGGATVYHDGIIIDGVDATGKQNDIILEAADYYLTTYSWGPTPNSSYEDAVFDNNFIKLREVALNYSIPVRLANKMKVQKLTVGLFGRNLLYLYKTIENVDPEAGMGTSFVRQGIGGGTMAASRTIGANLRLSF